MIIFYKIINFFKKKKPVVDINVPFCKKTLTDQIQDRKSYYVYKIQRNEQYAYSCVSKHVQWRDGYMISSLEYRNKELFKKMYFLEEIRLEELDLPHRLN